MRTRILGQSGIDASVVGLCTWAIGGWMWGGTDEAQAIESIRASIDKGITLIDPAPAYGMGAAEQIVAKAIAGRRDQVLIATKCGLVWNTDKGNPFVMQRSSDPSLLRAGVGPVRMRTEPQTIGHRSH
jgi:methylglyoxal reductase